MFYKRNRSIIFGIQFKIGCQKPGELATEPIEKNFL